MFSLLFFFSFFFASIGLAWQEPQCFLFAGSELSMFDLCFLFTFWLTLNANVSSVTHLYHRCVLLRCEDDLIC